jgi:outer membrane lipoprotein-sorting protein
MYEVMSAQKMVMVMPYDAAKERALAMTYTSGKFELVGPDTVDGQACTKYKETIANQVFFMWMDATKKFPIKATSEDGSISVSFTNFQEGPQDPALFEPPSGYQVTQMPSIPGAPAPSVASGDSTNGNPQDTQQITASTQTDDGMTAETIIEKVKAAYAALQSYSDTGTAVVQGGGSSTTTNFKIRLQRPGLYRVD